MTEIHLSDQDQAFIDEQVKDGRYKSADDVIAAGRGHDVQERGTNGSAYLADGRGPKECAHVS